MFPFFNMVVNMNSHLSFLFEPVYFFTVLTKNNAHDDEVDTVN